MNLRTAIELTMSDGHEPTLDDVQNELLELSRALRALESAYDYVGDNARGLWLLAHTPLSDSWVLNKVLGEVNATVVYLNECFRDEHSATKKLMRAEGLVSVHARDFVRDDHPDNRRALDRAVAWWRELEEEDDKGESEEDRMKERAIEAANHAQLALVSFLDRVRDKFPEEDR